MGREERGESLWEGPLTRWQPGRQPSTGDAGFAQAKQDKLSIAQSGGNLLGAAGAKTDLLKGEYETAVAQARRSVSARAAP